jgi:hypothetical protein
MHIVKLLEHRFPEHKAGIKATLLFLSASVLLLGLGLMLTR